MIGKPASSLLVAALAAGVGVARRADGSIPACAARRRSTTRARPPPMPPMRKRREGGAQLSRAAAGDPAHDRRLPDRPQRQQMPVLPCRARAPASRRRRWSAITHFMDRDGQFLAAVSPRRYFCTAVPRAAGRGEAAGRATISSTSTRMLSRAHAGRPAMSAVDPAAAAPICWRGLGFMRRAVGRAAPAELGVQPRLPGARRLRRRHHLLGRLQHRARSSPTPRSSAPAATRCATTSSRS